MNQLTGWSPVRTLNILDLTTLNWRCMGSNCRLLYGHNEVNWTSGSEEDPCDICHGIKHAKPSKGLPAFHKWPHGSYARKGWFDSNWTKTSVFNICIYVLAQRHGSESHPIIISWTSKPFTCRCLEAWSKVQKKMQRLLFTWSQRCLFLIDASKSASCKISKACCIGSKLG